MYYSIRKLFSSFIQISIVKDNVLITILLNLNKFRVIITVRNIGSPTNKKEKIKKQYYNKIKYCNSGFDFKAK